GGSGRRTRPVANRARRPRQDSNLRPSAITKGSSGSGGTSLDSDIPAKLEMMNPMYFIGEGNDDRAKYWWIRTGTSDSDTALTIVGNLALSLENLGDTVDAAMYWDGAHGADEDPADFITWIGEVTGYTG
ncbi:hypothetical protein ABZ372_50465, partial [Streptomyces sp. NPDC005921]